MVSSRVRPAERDRSISGPRTPAAAWAWAATPSRPGPRARSVSIPHRVHDAHRMPSEGSGAISRKSVTPLEGIAIPAPGEAPGTDSQTCGANIQASCSACFRATYGERSRASRIWHARGLDHWAIVPAWCDSQTSRRVCGMRRFKIPDSGGFQQHPPVGATGFEPRVALCLLPYLASVDQTDALLPKYGQLRALPESARRVPFRSRSKRTVACG
jgi:hypothetical protein